MHKFIIKCSGLDFKMPFMNAADPTKAYMAAWSGRCYLKDKMIQQGTGKLKVDRGCGSGWAVGETMSSGVGHWPSLHPSIDATAINKCYALQTLNA